MTTEQESKSLALSPSPRKKVTITFFVIFAMVLFMASMGLLKKTQLAGMARASHAYKTPPVAVTSMAVEAQIWYPVLQAVGSLSAAQGVMLSADLPGIVYKTPLGPGGTMVHKGDLLVQLDTRQEEAQLRSAEAKCVLAKSTFDRTMNLSEKSVVAKATLDDARAQYDSALGALEEIKVMIRRKTLYAPFDGMLGIGLINEGQYLQSGAPIVPLNLLDVLSVNFSLPQQNFSELHAGQAIRVKAEGVPHKTFEGTITGINSELDAVTRNIGVSGSIKNEDMLLRGGMFVTVEVLLPPKKNVIAVPETAINYAPYGDSVFVIESLKKGNEVPYLGVREQPVTLGTAQGDQVEIIRGLKVGDTIVTSGVFKLRPGCPVKINNTVQPENDLEPKTVDS
ncbi:MAG: efflux RND transporter periplasmic adaptor subunit [Verrucomicrobia bacterium]|nr:MAG: efflux RND transporter periplasmic adaptor subunit [Verrucomicrobiota bacterium]